MSSEAPAGLAIMEKLIGLVMIAVGAITFYTTYNNLSSAPSPLPFLAAGAILTVLGFLLLIARTGEKEK